MVSGLLVFVGLLVSSGLLLVVGSMVAVVWMTARLWERYCFRKVSYERKVGRRRAFIGDSIDYSISLTNDKPLPLIWVEAQDSFPEGLELQGAVDTRRQSRDQSPSQHHHLSPAVSEGHVEFQNAVRAPRLPSHWSRADEERRHLRLLRHGSAPQPP